MTEQETIDKLRSAHETLDGLRADMQLARNAFFDFEEPINAALKQIAECIDSLRKQWDLP